MTSTDSATLTLPPVDPAVLAEYAAASGDRNPLHVDPAAARAAGEPDVIAHGMLTMAYLGRLATQLHPLATLSAFRVRFVAKTPVGSQVTCHARVVERTADRVRTELWATREDGTTTTRGDALFAISVREESDD